MDHLCAATNINCRELGPFQWNRLKMVTQLDTFLSLCNIQPRVGAFDSICYSITVGSGRERVFVGV